MVSSSGLVANPFSETTNLYVASVGGGVGAELEQALLQQQFAAQVVLGVAETLGTQGVVGGGELHVGHEPRTHNDAVSLHFLDALAGLDQLSIA